MRYAEQVEAVIRATTFHSPLAYSWMGTYSAPLSSAHGRALPDRLKRKYLLYTLQSQLYNQFYCRGRPVSRTTVIRDGADSHAHGFTDRLIDANSGKGFRSRGWVIAALEGPSVVVRRSDFSLWVTPSDCVPDDAPLDIGTQVRLRFPKHLPGMSPGFYTAVSDRDLDDDAGRLVRVYWNLTAEGAIAFVRETTSGLNGAGLAFKIKALNDPRRFTRRDAVVLYIRKTDYQRVSALMETIYPRLVSRLKDGVVAFAKEIAPGAAVAEDPGNGESFGSHRCRILAEGLLRASEQRRNSVVERLQIVTGCFREHGIELHQPYLSGSAVDEYDFQAPARPVTAPRSVPKPLLQAAADIGEYLVRTAVWHEERCNWMGYSQGEQSDQLGAPVHYSALSGDLYSGTSGVSLFLAHLHAATGGRDARRTAMGAIRHALSQTRASLPESCAGAYTGWIGVALAAASVGRLLGEDELLERAAHIAHRTGRRLQRSAEFDLVSGKAGAIVALIVLRTLLRDEGLATVAARLGEQLIGSAERSAIGYSWKSPGLHARKNLTGFAHGTAGVAFALVELFQLTGDPRFRHAAERAIDYERHHFDATAGNWPDFRYDSWGATRTTRTVGFSMGWCHGAPGIALSRLRAFQVLKDPVLEAEALAALHTTLRTTRTWLQPDMHQSHSLCHGILGNAEILLHGSQVLGRSFSDGAIEARDLALASLASGHWMEDTAPIGLMVGLAGAGYACLRLHEPETPSLLLLGSDRDF